MARTPVDTEAAAEMIKDFHLSEGRMPSMSEIAELFAYKSKNAAFELVSKLVEKGFLKKDAKGRLLLAGGASGRIRVLGTVQAGFPTPAEEQAAESVSIEHYLVSHPEKTFMLQVSGDSMIDAGIHAGDMVLVERGRDAREGDIVVARVDGEWTLKTYEKRAGRPILVPANKRYPLIRPAFELHFGGVVVGVVRKYR